MRQETGHSVVTASCLFIGHDNQLPNCSDELC